MMKLSVYAIHLNALSTVHHLGGYFTYFTDDGHEVRIRDVVDLMMVTTKVKYLTISEKYVHFNSKLQVWNTVCWEYGEMHLRYDPIPNAGQMRLTLVKNCELSADNAYCWKW